MGMDKNNLVVNSTMGHYIKGQRPSEYRPSKTRRNSKLNRILEGNPNAQRRWAKIRAATLAELKGNVIKRGRFIMRTSSTNSKKNSVMLMKNAPRGIYFVSQPYKRGRFTVENVLGFVPYPTK